MPTAWSKNAEYLRRTSHLCSVGSTSDRPDPCTRNLPYEPRGSLIPRKAEHTKAGDKVVFIAVMFNVVDLTYL